MFILAGFVSIKTIIVSFCRGIWIFTEKVARDKDMLKQKGMKISRTFFALTGYILKSYESGVWLDLY